jgi:drug/metabolite transporter (DMT)-like permease
MANFSRPLISKFMSELPPNPISRPVSFLRSGWPALLVTLCIWTGFILMSRAAGKGVLTSWDVTALRLGTGGIIALFFLPRVKLPDIKVMVLFALFGAIGYACFVYSGFRLAPAAHGAVLAPGCLPLATAIVAWLWFKKKPNRKQMIALLGIGIGILMIATDSLSAQGHLTGWQLVGDLLFICAAFSWAVFTVLLRENPMPPLTATVSTVLAGALMYLPVWWLFLPSTLSFAPAHEIAMQALYQGVLVVFVALITYAHAVRQLGPQIVALTLGMVPVLASLGAVPLLDEPLSILALSGLLAVTAAAVLGVRASR